MKKTILFILFFTSIYSISAENKDVINIEHIKSTDDVLRIIKRQPSNWYKRNNTISEPLDLNDKLLLNQAFIYPLYDPFFTLFYSLYFFENGLFIYGSTYNGAQICSIGNYSLNQDIIKLFNIKHLNKAKIIPTFLNNNYAELKFDTVNQLDMKYGLVEINTLEQLLLPGIKNNIGDTIYIDGIESKYIFEFGQLSKDTIGLNKPFYNDFLIVNNFELYNDNGYNYIQDDGTFLIFNETFIVMLGETITEDGRFFYCDIPVTSDFISGVKVWVHENNLINTGF